MAKLETLLEHIEELIASHMPSQERGASPEAADTLTTLREVRDELRAAIESHAKD
jgi:hypothetical protein